MQGCLSPHSHTHYIVDTHLWFVRTKEYNAYVCSEHGNGGLVLEKQAQYMYLQLFVLSCLILRVYCHVHEMCPRCHFQQVMSPAGSLEVLMYQVSSLDSHSTLASY